MNHQTPRLRESQLDAALACLLSANTHATGRFLSALPSALRSSIRSIDRQTRHEGGAGTIDLEIRLSNGVRLLCENKIDAGWSVTAAGEAQPERYRRSVDRLRARGVAAHSVLIAPQVYLDGSTRRAAFDHAVTYETLAESGSGPEVDLLHAAIVQAATPYEPEPNTRSRDFFAAYAALATAEFPELVLKRNPNGGDVRPTASRTIYFDAKRMLQDYAGVPRPRISVQAWDSGAASASAKLMIGRWGHLAARVAPPDSLGSIGGYLRPARRSLGLVVDTPRLDTQAPFAPQRDAARAGLSAIEALTDWWNDHAKTVIEWSPAAEQSR